VHELTIQHNEVVRVCYIYFDTHCSFGRFLLFYLKLKKKNYILTAHASGIPGRLRALLEGVRSVLQLYDASLRAHYIALRR